MPHSLEAFPPAWQAPGCDARADPQPGGPHRGLSPRTPPGSCSTPSCRSSSPACWLPPPVVLGVVEGCARRPRDLQAVAGRWSDGRRRLPFVTTGYGMAVLGKVVVAASYAGRPCSSGRVVDRLGKGACGRLRATPSSRRRRPEGLRRAFASTGWATRRARDHRPLLARRLAALDGETCAQRCGGPSCPAVLSTLLTPLLVVERRRAPARRRRLPRRPSGVTTRSRSSPREFWRSAWCLVGIAVVNFPTPCSAAPELGFTTTRSCWPGVVTTSSTRSALPGVPGPDRLPRPLVYGIGLVAFAAAYAGLRGRRSQRLGLRAARGVRPLPAFHRRRRQGVDLPLPEEHRGRAQGVFQSLSNGAVFVAGCGPVTWTLGPGRASYRSSSGVLA